MTDRLRRMLMGWLLALPAGRARAQGFGFQPPRDPDDPAAVAAMRDLAQRVIPVYQNAGTDAYLANLAALQIVSGAYAAAYDSSRLLRGRHPREAGKPPDPVVERAIADGLYARARAIEAADGQGFAAAYARAFREQLPSLGDAAAAAVVARLEESPARYREPVAQAFDRWRAQGSIPQDEAVALVRAWHAYESRRSVAAHLPELVAAETARRGVLHDEVVIEVRPGVLLHARVARPGPAGDAVRRPTLLRFTLDPAEDDARRSAARGYVGVTAYVRGRRPDGSGAVWPFVHDGDDAAAVIEWIARQPWSDGRVAMLGDGYSGCTAWAAARRRPAALRAIATIAPMAPGIDVPMAGQIVRNGFVRWLQEHALAEPALARTDAQWQALDARWYRRGGAYWDLDRLLLGKRSALVRTWLSHPSHDRYWRKFLPSPEQFARIDIPVLGIGGYYGAAAGALHFHREHLRHRPHADDTLLLGPWDAASIRPGTAASLRGLAIDPVARVDLPALRDQWLDHVLAGANKPALLLDRVNLQVMGANRWQHAPSFEPADRKRLRLYLEARPGGGTHRLSSVRPAGGASARLAVDLVDRRDARTPPAPALRTRQPPSRNSLHFVSDPLPRDTVVDGRASGSFELTPSRQDVDLSIALYEQTASGDVLLLFEPEAFRASYAGDRSKRRLLRAGVRQTLAFASEGVTARKLAAGSRLMLSVGIEQRPDRQVNAGSGKDVNSETLADAPRPMRVRWHAGSFIEIPSSGP